MLRALLLTLVTLFCFNVQAQDIHFGKRKAVAKKTVVKTQKADVKQSAKKMTAKTTATTGNELGVSNGKVILKNQQKSSAVGTDIGTTTYDLQSNHGMCRRIAVGGDGAVHAVWTRSTSGDIAAPDRGTGYNTSADGGDTWADMPSARVEGSLRTGWPNVGVTESGRIFSISHTGDAGMNFAYKDPDGDWTNKGVGAENGDVDGVWARAGNDGAAIHAVIARQTSFGGLTNGLAYFRSFDEGDTWEGPIELPLQGVVAQVWVDGYFVDVKGDVVVIGLGGYGMPVVVLKSTDKGDNFEVVTVQGTDGYQGGLDPTTDPNGGYLAPTPLSDGNISVLLDNDGKLHVWYDKLLNFNDVGDEGPFFLSAFCGVMYWNEDMDAPRLLGKSTRQDMDGDGIAEFGTEVDVQLYGNVNVSQISSGVDADNNLYIAFSSTRDGAFDPSNPAFLYRDILMMKSTDGGATWEGPHNVTDDPNSENVFPSIARTVTDKVHLVYQHDELAGVAVQPGHETYVENSIKYVGVPVGDIVTPELNSTEPVMTSAIFGLVPFALQNCPANIARFDAQAQDFPDGDLTDQIEISGVDVSMAGEQGPWVLTVTDSDDNTSTFEYIDADENPILIDVIEDTEAPLIVPKPYEVTGAVDLEGWYTTADSELFLLAGSDSVDVIVGTEYVDAGADIIDEGDVFGCPSTLTVNNPVNTDEIGVYEVTYNGVDANGKEAEPVVRVVTVISEDLTAPQLVLADAGGNEIMEGDTIDVEFEAGGTWSGLDVFAFDNVDGDISDKVTTEGEVDLETVGIYTVAYSVADNAGNSTSSTVYIKIADTQPPVINLAGPATVVWTCGTPFDNANLGFTAFDNVDGNITDNVAETYLDPAGAELIGVCVTQAGTYKIVYKVVDSAGNEAEVTRSIIVPGPCDEGPCEYAEVDTSVSVNDFYLQEAIQLAPNPTQGIVNITLEDINGSVLVEVYNVTGQLVKTTGQLNIRENLTIDLSGYANGIYMIRVRTTEGSTTKKVLVK